MNPAMVTLVIGIIEVCGKYGPGVVASLITALNKDEITLEDIQGLKITKEPEEF